MTSFVWSRYSHIDIQTNSRSGGGLAQQAPRTERYYVAVCFSHITINETIMLIGGPVCYVNSL